MELRTYLKSFQVYKLLPKVSRIEIMSCEVSRLCEIEFLDAINNERQALARRKNQTNDQNRAQSGSSGVRSGSNSSIHPSVGRFSWLYEELMDRFGDKNDKEFVNKIVADLNQKWTCEEKHRQQSLNLIIKEMKKQTYSGKLSEKFFLPDWTVHGGKILKDSHTNVYRGSIIQKRAPSGPTNFSDWSRSRPITIAGMLNQLYFRVGCKRKTRLHTFG